MSVTELDSHIYLIDTETAGIKDFIASYILKGDKAALVETGPTSAVPNVLSALEKLRINREDVAYVAVSHVHLDHGGGVGALLEYLPNARVIVHPKGAPHLAHPEKLWKQSRRVLGKITDYYGAPVPVPEGRIVSVSDGMVFDLGGAVSLRVIETVGHASHHQSYYEACSGAAFPGDAAGIYLPSVDVVIPTTPAPFHLDLALASIEKLEELEPRSLLFSHFGRAIDPTKKLASYRAELKLWAKIIEQQIRSGESLVSIKDKILEADLGLRKALDVIGQNPILEETVFSNSVEGVVNYVQKSLGDSAMR